MAAIPLQPEHEAAIEELLLDSPEVNLFLLSLLGSADPDIHWWGVSNADETLSAVVMVLGGLAVPYARQSEDGTPLGRALRAGSEPYMVVGPRGCSDTLWAAWSDTPPRVCFDQRLYVATPPAPADDGLLVRATLADIDEISALVVAMQLEDLGTDPREHGEDRHRSVITERITSGRTLVMRSRGEITFLVHVGTRHPFGCQIGGTYVPPGHRGKGIATRGVCATVHRLLRTHPRVTLHVNEANQPAVTVYERSGFRRAAPFRLMIV